jgi:hypothetical protein
MDKTSPDASAERLRRQRNLFGAIAMCSLASIAFAVPRKLANYRELKAVNAHITDMQSAIVRAQRDITAVEDQIRDVQREIGIQATK